MCVCLCVQTLGRWFCMHWALFANFRRFFFLLNKFVFVKEIMTECRIAQGKSEPRRENHLFIFLFLSLFGGLLDTERRYFRCLKCVRKYVANDTQFDMMNEFNSYRKNKDTNGNEHSSLCDASAWHKRIRTHMGVSMMIPRTHYASNVCVFMLRNIFHMLSVCYCSHFYHYLCFTFTHSVSSIWIWWMRKTHLQIGVIREREKLHLFSLVRVCMLLYSQRKKKMTKKWVWSWNESISTSHFVGRWGGGSWYHQRIGKRKEGKG